MTYLQIERSHRPRGGGGGDLTLAEWLRSEEQPCQAARVALDELRGGVAHHAVHEDLQEAGPHAANRCTMSKQSGEAVSAREEDAASVYRCTVSTPSANEWSGLGG